jgi:hypothetical protein
MMRLRNTGDSKKLNPLEHVAGPILNIIGTVQKMRLSLYFSLKGLEHQSTGKGPGSTECSTHHFGVNE